MNREESFKIAIDHIQEIIKKYKLVMDGVEIKEDSNFFYNLGFDSLDMTELIMDLEATLNISIPDTDYEKISKVSELVTLLQNKHHE